MALLSDVPGVLDGDKKLIADLDKSQAEQLIAAGVITDGMIVKVEAALQAAQELGRTIEVASWRSPEKLFQLLAGQAIGTQFKP